VREMKSAREARWGWVESEKGQGFRDSQESWEARILAGPFSHGSRGGMP
jgi:hypothetical protein